MSSLRPVLVAPLLGLLLLLGSSGRGAASSPLAVAASAPVFADAVSWYGFTKYWKGFVKNSDRVIVIVALVAAAALFIITRGKWLK